MARPKIEYLWFFKYLDGNIEKPVKENYHKPPTDIDTNRPFYIELVRNELTPDGLKIRAKSHCIVDVKRMRIPEYFDQYFPGQMGIKIPQKQIEIFETWKKKINQELQKK